MKNSEQKQLKYLAVTIKTSKGTYSYAVGHNNELVSIRDKPAIKFVNNRQRAHQIKQAIIEKFGNVDVKILPENSFNPGKYIERATDKLKFLDINEVSEEIFGRKTLLKDILRRRTLTLPEAKAINVFARKVAEIIIK